MLSRRPTAKPSRASGIRHCEIRQPASRADDIHQIQPHSSRLLHNSYTVAWSLTLRIRRFCIFLGVGAFPTATTMSFKHSSILESQPTNWRREDDPQYADDPEFRDFASKLSDDLFALTRNVARLSTEIAKLGTKHETARVRERVKTTSDETSEKFKEIGEGLKRITTWPDVGV